MADLRRSQFVPCQPGVHAQLPVMWLQVAPFLQVQVDAQSLPNRPTSHAVEIREGGREGRRERE